MDDDVTMRTNDNTTDRRLLLLVGLVVVSGVVVLGWSCERIARESRTVGLSPVVVVALCAVAYSANFPIRIRASNLHISVMSSAVLVAAAVLPPEWVGICAAAGALLWNLYARTAVLKRAFNVSKESLAASAAAAMMVALGMTPVQPLSVADPFSQRALAMLGAALAYAIVDEGLSVPIVALATGTSIRHRF